MKKLFAATFVAQLMVTTTALAQTEAAAPRAAKEPQAASAAESGEIIVTAQKRSERLQDVPIALSVVNAASLAKSGVTDMTQLTAVVPGLNIATATGSFQPSIRGISTGSNVVENPVALYIDGVYLPNQREGLRDLSDAEQVTVLKGPQGTLFGRNATAGVIQITTKGPAYKFGGDVKAGYDNYGTFRGSAFVTDGLTDTLAASLFASYSRQSEGWGRSVNNGMDNYQLRHNITLRGKLQFNPSDRTKVTLIADYLDREDSGRSFQPYPGTIYWGIETPHLDSRYDTNSVTPGYNAFKSRGVSLNFEQNLDFAKLVSITSYRRGTGGFKFDFVGVKFPYLVTQADLRNHDFTQELQLVSPSGGRVQWVAGVYYYFNQINYADFPRVITNFPVGPNSATSRVDGHAYENSRSIAPFAQADVKLTGSTTLTLGGRWTYEKREIVGTQIITLLNGKVIVNNPPADNTLTINKPTWRLALNQKLAPDINAYLSYNRGIKSGGFNISTPQSPAYKAERLDAFEAGLKSRLFDRRLTLNLSAFLNKYGNLQVSTFVGGLTPIVTNGAKAEMYGLDADFQARVTDELSLRGGLQLMHAKFTDYMGAPISSQNPVTGQIIVKPGDASGNRLPYAQTFTGTIAADYTRRIGNVNTTFNATANYNGDYYFEADNFMRQKAYVMLNSSLRLADASDTLSLTFAVTNILDKPIITNVSTQGYAYFAAFGGAPRVYSVTAGVKF